MNYGENQQKRENGKPQNFVVGGYKKSLRIFFNLVMATTLAFGLTGCGNNEAPAEEAEIAEEIETEETEVSKEVEAEEDSSQEVIGEDSTDTLTFGELLEGVGSSNIVEALEGKNQDVLDLMTDWMGQNGYYNIEATLLDEYTPSCNASATLQSDGSVMDVCIEINPGNGGSFYVAAYNVYNDRGVTYDFRDRLSELPSALELNKLIEQRYN